MPLPRYFVLQSADADVNYSNYLRYVDEGGYSNGSLHFRSGQQAISPFSKHEFEPAREESNQGLYHIRCGYNNKYWTRKPDYPYGVTATADEPDEDRSNSCTLFDPTTVHDSKVRLLHVASNRYVSANRGSGSVLYARTALENLNDLHSNFSITNWENFVILPERVVFKGDNGRYLCLHNPYGSPHQYLKFDTTDFKQPAILHTVSYTPDGKVRIKSEANSKFWNLSPSWIWAESSEETHQSNRNNSDSLFWVVKGQGDNEVAIQNVANNKYCQRLTADGKTDCLNARASIMSGNAILKVEEPVVTRKIDNVNFRINEAKFYGERVVSLLKKETHNKMPDTPSETTISETYTRETTSTWKASVSLKLGVKFTVEAGVKIIAKGKLETSADLQTGYEYGVANKKLVTATITDKITIPASSTVTVSVIATETKYDVPYSYTQLDTLTDGTQVSYEKHDGMYSGCNSYNFNTVIDFKKI